ncbi:MAG: dihydroneopterin aldolase [Bacteroidia bacterium]|nr:dihydroneopterin aldolase [Bacteroidia bacterium]
MGKIEVTGMEFYAYHGCMEEEARVGGKYLVDVTVEAGLGKAAETDSLRDTVDYVAIYSIAREEMAVRSRLIETVAGRMACRIKDLNGVHSGTVIIKKLSAPVGGVVHHVSVTFPF